MRLDLKRELTGKINFTRVVDSYPSMALLRAAILGLSKEDIYRAAQAINIAEECEFHCALWVGYGEDADAAWCAALKRFNGEMPSNSDEWYTLIMPDKERS